MPRRTTPRRTVPRARAVKQARPGGQRSRPVSPPRASALRHFSGSPWEPEVGYCRALRRGDLVFVSGTAPVEEGGGVHAPGDAYAQARRCLEIAVRALAALGARPSDVVRTRMYVTDASRWREIGRAHREVLGAHPPAATLVEVKALVDPAMLVEVELDAVVARRTPGRQRRGPASRGRKPAS
jgi:enamine deaminase RidA (YjgF/YER057c/UK114 family)